MNRPVIQGIPENTPLGAYLKIISALEILKLRGTPLQVVLMPDSLIDLEASDYARLCKKQGAIFALETLKLQEIPPELEKMLGSLIQRHEGGKGKEGEQRKFSFSDPFDEEGAGRHRVPSGQGHRERRAGGHAANAAQSLQMLHRRELPLFDLTFLTKTGKVGRTYLEQSMGEQVKELGGFPLDMSYVLDTGQNRLTLYENEEVMHEGQKFVTNVYRYVDPIDREKPFVWAELEGHPARPLDRLKTADALGLFSPKARIFDEALDNLSKDSWLQQVPKKQVILLDMTNIQLQDVLAKGKTEQDGLAVLTTKTIKEKVEKIREVAARLLAQGHLPVISLGFLEAMPMGRACSPQEQWTADGGSRPSVGEAIEALAKHCGCPVFYHHVLYSRVVDPTNLLGLKQESDGFAPSFALQHVEVRNAGTDCHNAGLLLGLAVLWRLRQLPGVPKALIPTVKECMLLGNLLAAAYLEKGNFPTRAEVYHTARTGGPRTHSQMLFLLHAPQVIHRPPARDPQRREPPRLMEERDLPTKEQLGDAAWCAKPLLDGLEAQNLDLPRLIEEAERAISQVFLPHGPASRPALRPAARPADAAKTLAVSPEPHPSPLGNPLVGALGMIFEKVWPHKPTPGGHPLSSETLAAIWEAVEKTSDSTTGRLLVSALIQALSFDRRFFSSEQKDREALAPPWVQTQKGKARLVVFVGLDGTLFDSHEVWRRSMRSALARFLERDEAQVIEAHLEQMRTAIYDNHAFFKAWETQCDFRQVWCTREHFLAFQAFLDLQPAHENLAGDLANAGKSEQNLKSFMESEAGREFLRVYRHLDADEKTRDRIDEAVKAFYDVPCVPYLDAAEFLHFLERILGLDVYICSDGKQAEQVRKLLRMRLFLDEKGRAKRDRVLTTGDAANPVEDLNAIRDAIAERRRGLEAANGRLEFIEILLREQEALKPAADIGYALKVLMKDMVGSELTKEHERRLSRAFREIGEDPHRALREWLEDQKLETEKDIARRERDIEGLRYVRGIFDGFSHRHETPFFARCVHAVQEDPQRPERFLRVFTLPGRDMDPPMMLIVIGDRYERDCKPAIESAKRPPDGARQGARCLTTIRLLAGEHRREGLEWRPPEQRPTFQAVSLSEIVTLLLRRRTWEGMAGVKSVALLNKLPNNERLFEGFVKARLIRNAPRAVTTVLKLVLEAYSSQDHKSKDGFRRLLNVVSLQDGLAHDMREMIKQITDEINIMDGVSE